MAYPEEPDSVSQSHDTPSPRWWLPGDDSPTTRRDRAMALATETAAIEMRQSTWHETNLWNGALYTNREMVGFRWGTIEAHGELIPKDLRTENLVQEIGQALLAKAQQSPLRPSLVPHGNSFKVEKAVRRLDKLVAGTWRHIQAEEACIQAFLDAYIAGLGCVRVGWDQGSKSMTAESVFFDNIIIDNRECSNRSPPRHYRIRQVAPRSVVEARFNVDLGTEKTRAYDVDYRQAADGWVVVVEAWRLPDNNGKGGRHCIVAAGHLLLDHEWDEPWVPLYFMHWEDPVSGFFPRGGVELMVPYQIRMNQLNDAIEESQDIACRPRMLVHGGTNIDVSQWDNEAGRLLGYTGMKPEPLVWPTNLAELLAERERVRQMAHAYMGVPVMFATGQPPDQMRFDSSAAQREFLNMADSRHLRLWETFESFKLAVAKGLLLVLGSAKGSEDFAATFHPGGSRARAEKIPYDAVRDLVEDQYSWTLDAKPLSTLSPAARRELVRDWQSRQLIDPNEARRMEGNPNLERIEDLEMASYDDILRHLQIMEEGGYEAPEEGLTNLVYGIPRVTQNYLRLKDYREDDEVAERDLQRVLESHQRWLAAAGAIQAAAIRAQQEQQALMQAQAMAQEQAKAFGPTQGLPGTAAAGAGVPAGQ